MKVGQFRSDHLGLHEVAQVQIRVQKGPPWPEPFVLKFSNADNLLGNEMCGALHGLVSTFSFIGASWARAVEEGEPWDCAARRFLVVLEYV